MNRAFKFQTTLRGTLTGILFLIVAANLRFAAAQTDQTGTGFRSGQNMAILIPVASFKNLGPQSQLAFTLNDVEHLTRTLRERGGFDIYALSEKSTNPGWHPTKKNIMEQLPQWLAKCDEDDTVIVYVSTHGFADKTNRQITYIMPSDHDPQNVTATSIPASWLRTELGKCKAKTKLLLIDACHAGGEGGPSDPSFADGRASELAQYSDEGDDLKNVFVIASSTKDERSYLFPKKNLSLFSYWANEGLKGHADVDCNGAISIDELYHYTYRNVVRTAAKLGLDQTPVRIVRTETPGVPNLMKTKPITLDSLLEQIADQMAMAMDIYDQKQTAVPEFTVNTGVSSLLGREKYGLLSTYCADEIERRLKAKLVILGHDDFQIVQREKLQSTLKERRIDTAALEGIVKGTGDVPPSTQPTQKTIDVNSIILGTLRDRNKADVHIQCELVNVSDRNTINVAGGLATLTENEWAMLGRSVIVQQNDRLDPGDHNRETLDTTTSSAASYAPLSVSTSTDSGISALGQSDVYAFTTNEDTFDQWDERSETTHPLFRTDSSFQVEIAVKNRSGRFQTRPIQNIDGQAVVTLRQGEVYRIHLKNKLPEEVAARVLVDGLNTLPERKSGAKAKFSAIENDSRDLEIGPRVSLARARFWIIAPADSQSLWNMIPGFFRDTGTNGKYHEFRVSDAPNSLAAQKEYTDEIGIITVAFYTLQDEPSLERNVPFVGTKAGDIRSQKIQERKNVSAGPLLAVFHIRYVGR